MKATEKIWALHLVDCCGFNEPCEHAHAIARFASHHLATYHGRKMLERNPTHWYQVSEIDADGVTLGSIEDVEVQS